MQISIKKDTNERGIWQFASYLEPVEKQFRLTLGETGTAEEYFIPFDVWLKREDSNPNGSLKDRGMAFLISWAWSKGNKKFVLSSSGNAAISACEYCKKANLELKIFVSPNIDQEKLVVLHKKGADISVDVRSLTMAARFSKENGYYNLRPSINEFGSEGYQTTAFELAESQGVISDIFIPVSSGVNLLGIYRGFEKVGFMPRLHLCQSSTIHPLAESFDTKFKVEEQSLAKALVARHSPLKSDLLEAIKNSHGCGWVIENGQIERMQEVLKQHNISTSNEGTLALAAVEKARKTGWKLGKTIVLLTGKRY